MARLGFVTGATGFIGRRVVRVLLDAGWGVRALVLPGEEAPPLPAAVEVVRGDVTVPDSLRGAMDGMDAAFHLAARVSPWERDPRAYLRVNVEGTRNVVGEAMRASVPRFVFTSSMSGIGVQEGAVTREDSPPGRVFGAYEASKAEAERVVERAVREDGLPAVTLIPSIVVGPGDTRNSGATLLAFVRGELPARFAEDSLLPLVAVDDVARAHLLAYERGKVGSRYIVSGENVPWGELLRIASRASGTPVPSRRVGPLAVRLVTRMSELRSRVTRSPPPLPAWLADFMLTGAPMDNSRSVRELGMEYAPVAGAIEAAIVWFREEGLFAGPRPPRPAVLGGLPAENPPAPPETAVPGGPPEGAVPGALADRRPRPRRPA
ncbi:MAG: hypothetical protein A3K65_01585 [Euryarchaeota archaeon RBG_16_68_12]|nr:MAG: hypothetical protein A3K65_01585 [Euryarchaeota archaeon RBG_16_68_12]